MKMCQECGMKPCHPNCPNGDTQKTKKCTAIILIDKTGAFILVDADEFAENELLEKWQDVQGDQPTPPTRVVRATFIVPIPKEIVVPVITVPEEKVTVELK